MHAPLRISLYNVAGVGGRNGCDGDAAAAAGGRA
jgi:hypothetical protein